MMDLVERLRDAVRDVSGLLNEAAAEIERLRGVGDIPSLDADVLNRRLADINFGKGLTLRARSLYRWDENYENSIPIETIRDLIQMTEVEVMRCPNVGRATLNRIKTVLAEHGLTLGMVFND